VAWALLGEDRARVGLPRCNQPWGAGKSSLGAASEHWQFANADHETWILRGLNRLQGLGAIEKQLQLVTSKWQIYALR